MFVLLSMTDGDMSAWYMGFVYHDYSRRVTWTAPLPINVALRVCYIVWRFMYLPWPNAERWLHSKESVR
jgi:hypothetical protein